MLHHDMFELFDDETATDCDANAPGKVRFDDRGNAFYQWSEPLAADNQQAETLRARALTNPTLALIDDSPDQGSTSIMNAKGLRLGYNPYQSGQLSGKSATRKHDIRELSKWIEQQRRMGLLKPATNCGK